MLQWLKYKVKGQIITSFQWSSSSKIREPFHEHLGEYGTL